MQMLGGMIAGNPGKAYDEGRLGSQKVATGDADAAGDAAFGRALTALYGGGSQAPPTVPPGQPSMPTQPTGGMPSMGGGAPPMGGGMPPSMPGGPQMAGGAMPSRPPMPMPGGPPQPMGGPPPQPGMPPMGGGPPGMPPQGPPSFGQPGGGMTWQAAVMSVVQANPGIQQNPRALARAVDHFMPIMNQQSIQQWREIQAQAKIDQGDARWAALDAREAADRLRSEDRGLDRASRETMTGMRQAGATERTGMQQAGATERAGMRPEVSAFQSFMEKNPNATPQEQSAFIKSYKGGGAGGGGTTAIALQRYLQENPEASSADISSFLKGLKPESATSMRLRAGNQRAESVVSTIDDALESIQTGYKGGVPVTGIGGKATRIAEIISNLAGWSDQTLANKFETQINIIKNQLPRILSGSSITNKEERARVDSIVRGLTAGSTIQITVDDLKYLQKVVRRLEFNPDQPDRGGRQDREPSRPSGALKPIDLNIQTKMEEAARQGYSRAEIEKYLRSQGYDPARSQ